MTDNNDINLETIVVDNNPDILLKKQIEKKSGEIAAKVKLTNATFSSLVTNVVSDKIKKITSSLNRQLAAQKKAILEAEERRVKEEEKRGQAAAGENAIDLAFKLEEKLSKATEKDVVISTLDKYNAVVTQIDSPRLNMKPKTKSRALIIKRVLAKYCERIGISWKKYRKEEEIAKKKESDGVSWETLFSGVELSSENILDNNISATQDEDASNLEKITTEEKERRTLISDIGSELSDIRKRLKSFEENPSFSRRLKTREDSLLQMLSKIINNDSFIVNKDIENPIHEEKTEMQMVIEESVGYKPALSEEEYKKVAQELEAYYQDPTVGERMHDLMLKDILVGMNNEEAARKIDAAERTANVEGLNTGDVRMTNDASDYKHEGAIQAEMLFQQGLKEWANEQASLLYEKDKLLDGANNQAGLLYEKKNLLDGANNQAGLLYEKDKLLEGANNQARQLFARKEQTINIQSQPQLTPQLQPQMQPNSNYVISDSYGRYGNQVSTPKPIKIDYGRLSNIRNCGKPKNNLRDNLISLRDQLNSLPSGEVVKEEIVMPKVAA